MSTYLTCAANPALGSAYVALGFAEALLSRGYLVDVFSPENYEPLRWLNRGTFYRQSLGLALHSLMNVARRAPQVMLFYGGEAWLAMQVLSRLPKRSRPLLVLHSNGLEAHCAEYLAAARFSGTLGRQRWYQLELSKLASRAARIADALVVVSEFEGRFARERRLPASGQLLVIENPLPAAYLSSRADVSRENVIGFCGSWIERKGTEFLIREIPEFLRRNPTWRFRILGSEGSDVYGLFSEDVRARVEVLPAMEREGRLAREYRRLAILVSPSVYESFGLSVAEALSQGCAVVTTPVGFAAELVDGVEVIHVKPEIPGALVEGLERLAQSSAFRERIALAGQKRVQNLVWDSAARRFDFSLTSWLQEIREGATKGPHTPDAGG